MSLIPPDHPQYGDVLDMIDGDPYDHLDDDEFDGLYCACGRRMHAADVECERCWRDREYPQA